VNTLLIVLVLGAIAVGIVVWTTRRKPDSNSNAPRESDTAWNDPVAPTASPMDPDKRP
jgi:hypothetical protein